MEDSDCVVYFVLFFKLNTVYELRMSVWSSDVCSSDLGDDGADDGDDQRVLDRVEQRRRREIGGVVGEADIPRRAQHDAPEGVGVDLLPLGPGEALGADQEGGELGREACRERVCQYV